MAPSDREINIEKRKSAKIAFNEYLQQAARPEHFLSVDDKLAPLRRMDGDSINPTRRKFIGSRFTWNDTTSRWEVYDGSVIVVENEIWDFLLRVLSETGIRCHKKLSDRFVETTEGLLRQDVRIMLQIWNEHGLDQLTIDPETQQTDRENADPEQRGEDSIRVTPSSSISGEPTSLNVEASSPNTPEAQPEVITNTFHPRYSDFLCVGMSRIDGLAVWFAWRPLPGGQKPAAQFYNSNLEAKSKGELKITWHAHFDLEKFEGTPKEKGIGRRDYCRRLIRENESKITKPTKPTKSKKVPATSAEGSAKANAKASTKAVAAIPPTGSQKEAQSHHDYAVTNKQPTSRKRRHQDDSLSQPPANPSEEPTQPTAKRQRRAPDNHAQTLPTPDTTDSPEHAVVETETPPSTELEMVSENPVPQHPIIIKPEPRTYEQISRTSLLVSASNQPDIAPASVPFASCRTLDELFTTMISEYDIESSTRITKASATYTWNGKRHLLRRDRQEDWVLFCNAIKKAWAREENQVKFLEDGCEIGMMVHVEIGAVRLSSGIV